MKKKFILINNKKFIYNTYIIERSVHNIYSDCIYYIKKNKNNIIIDILMVSLISYKNKPSYKWKKTL